jgi:hypothetical protein
MAKGCTSSIVIRLTRRQRQTLRTWIAGAGKWDVAWHDLWTEEGCGAPGLQVLHAELLMRFRDACGQQGAWACSLRLRRQRGRSFTRPLPREFKRRWPFPLLGA